MRYFSVNCIFLLLLVFFFSCSSGSSDAPNQLPLMDNKAEEQLKVPSEQFAPVKGFKGGCFHTSHEQWDELVNVSLSEKGGLSGTGVRHNQLYNQRFDLNISGKQQKDGSYDVTIISLERRNKQQSTHYENWSFKHRKLTVKNRNTTDFLGDFSYFQVNCNGISKEDKDSTLYDGVFAFSGGYAVVMKDGLFGVINEKWQLTVPCQYKDLGAICEDAVVFYDDKVARFGALDVNNNIIIPAKYDQLTGFSEGLTGFLDKGKWGFMDKKGNVVIPPTYFMINFYQPMPARVPFNEGLANVAIEDAKWGFINPSGKLIIPYQFRFAEQFKEGRARVMRQGEEKWIYIDKSGACVEGCE